MISVFGSKVGEEEHQATKDCFDNQWLGMGPKTKEFESKFAQRLGLPNFILVNSGSNALHLAIDALNLPPGSDIVLPSFTWVACANAIMLAGHHPVFCDVDLDTMNVTAETIRSALTPRTAAIMVVHYAGKPVHMKPILALGLPVIEDVAHAVDSKQDGSYCGTFGEAAIYSFDAVKNLVMGEGGGVTFKSKECYNRALQLRYCGIHKSGLDAATTAVRWWEHGLSKPFPKMVPSDLGAAIGLVQLQKLDQLQAIRKQQWEFYQREFYSHIFIKEPKEPEPNEQHSYFTYVVRLPQRDRIAKALLDKGIYTTLRYHPLHFYPQYGHSLVLENTEKLAVQALSLPLHPRLTQEEQVKVVQELVEFKL